MSNHSYAIDPPSAEGARVGDLLEITGDEAHHAVAVKRTAPGEHIDLLDGRGTRLLVEVLEAAKDRMSVKVLDKSVEAAPEHPVGLIQALAKGDRDLQAVESAVELGVFLVRPWQADRSIVRWNAAKESKALAKWRAQVRSAQKQSRRSFEPEVLPPVGSKALSAQIGDLTAGGDLVLVLHEQADAPLAHSVRDWVDTAADGAKLWLIVGPEGGISDAEISLFRQAGAVPVLLGEHVLRASTAGPAALVLVRHLLGEL